MTDVLTRSERSEMMSRITGSNTKPEKLVQSMLRKSGVRFRSHVRALPGCPDIVLVRHRTVVLVHGCFWHRHSGCRYAYVPKSNTSFWTSKFLENVRRDKRVRAQLREAGWIVRIVWECETRNPDMLQKVIEKIVAKLPRGT